MTSSQTLFSRVAGAASADVDGDIVVISPADHRCFALNATATALWKLLPKAGELGRSRDDLVDRLVESFDVDRSVCETEVDGLLQSMLSAGVVNSAG